MQRAAGIDDAIVAKWCTEITKWAGKKSVSEAHAFNLVMGHLSQKATWKGFLKDVHVETDAGEKTLPTERLEKLLGLHGLLVAPLPRTEQTTAFTPEQLSALEEMIAAKYAKQTQLVNITADIDEVEGLELVEDDEIEIIVTEKADGGLEIDEEQFTRCMSACVQNAVAEVIGGEVRGALNRLRGRVD